MNEPFHIPVMRDEVLDYLRVATGGIYVDCTLGGGGHTEGILERGGRVIGIDRDEDAIAYANRRLERFSDHYELHAARFSQIRALVGARKGSINGIVMDLGVSSHMLDDPARGFSFLRDGPLNMAMGCTGRTAADVVRDLPLDDLSEIIREYGEERHARRIARAIVAARTSHPITTTGELADLVERTVGGPLPQKSKARVFQAIRIYVNDELGELEEGLAGALDVLAPGGRLCVIAYHSLEDRLVKRFFREGEHPCTCPSRLPCTCGKIPQLKILTSRPLAPTAEETGENSRARSARFRVAEKRTE